MGVRSYGDQIEDLRRWNWALTIIILIDVVLHLVNVVTITINP